jgi:hypothetical protein
MLNDFIDDRKSQCCVQVSESSWVVWKFEVEPPYFGKDADFLAKKNPVSANVSKSKQESKSIKVFSNVTAYIMRDVEYHVLTFEDNQSERRDNDYSTTCKGLSNSFKIA